jgi:hypothetical protein
MGRKIYFATAIVLCILFVSGCGLKFKDEMVNLSLPDDWKYRTPIKNTTDLRFHMVENAGLLVTPTSDPKVYRIIAKPILPDDFTAREETIKEGDVYTSKITQSASAQGSYLAFAADLSASQAVEFRIVDMSRADVPWHQLPDAKIRAAASIPNPDNNKRLWIQSLILSRILTQNYAEIKCNASGSGPAFQVGGKCYNSTGVEVHDYAIGTVLLDIDKYVRDNPGPSPSHSTISTLKTLDSFFGPMSKMKKGKGTMAVPGGPAGPAVPDFVAVEPPISEISNILMK